MSYADDLFIRMCQDIIDNGLSTEGEKVRPVWEDTGRALTRSRGSVWSTAMIFQKNFRH